MDILDVFGRLDDPRIERKKLPPMPEILLLTLSAVICGAEGIMISKHLARPK
jgi:hypothetical protein